MFSRPENITNVRISKLYVYGRNQFLQTGRQTNRQTVLLVEINTSVSIVTTCVHVKNDARSAVISTLNNFYSMYT